MEKFNKKKLDLVKIKIDKTYSNIFFKDSEFNALFPELSFGQMRLSDLKCTETGLSISWNYFDVFKKVSYIYWDKNSGTGLPNFYLEPKKLYSKTKLKKLSRSKDFKKQNYSFFNYGFLLSLLGLKSNSLGMSGLFK